MLRPVIGKDIPVARRNYIIRRQSTINYNLSFIVRTTVVLMLIAIFLGSGLFIPNNTIQKNNILPPPSVKGQLFGHSRYKEADQDQLIMVSRDIALHPAAAAMFKKMQSDAAADGINLLILSGFRSVELQRSIFFDIKTTRNQTAAERAKVSAPPGYSEHATGFAIDLGDGDNTKTNFSKSFEDTLAFQWLQRNANRYSFTLSFLPGNPHKISYEPWHWRFEGSIDALEIFGLKQ